MPKHLSLSITLLTILALFSLRTQAQAIMHISSTDGSQLTQVVGSDMRVDMPHGEGQELLRVNSTISGEFTLPLQSISSLSFSGATDLQGGSNSYIVTEAGLYTFATTRVDGTPIEGIDHADWLWMEKGDEALISNVSYTEGCITFSAGSGKGNAVIAAADAQGVIVWVWHIWLTDQPREMRYSSGVNVMDRNLGAVSAREADGRDTWGLTYQYGRSVPFYYIGDGREYLPSEAFDQACKHTVVNPRMGQQWGVESDKRKEGYTIAESMARPMTHLMRTYVSGTKAGYHWVPDDKLTEYVWGTDRVTDKTNYDPCPRGYKVPFYDELCDLLEMTWDPTQQGNMEYPVPGFSVNTQDGQQWWPLVCGRNYDDGCALFGGEAKEYSDRLFLWTAYAGSYAPTPLTYYAYAPLRILVENNYVQNNLRMYYPAIGAGAFGHVVRCVSDRSQPASSRHYTEGNPAADLLLTLADGRESTLLAIAQRTPYTLLYFNNPDCPACHTMQTQLQQSTRLQQLQAEGQLQIVSIYTDEEPELWRQHITDYPSSWTVTIDASQQVIRQGLYDLSRTPSLYLLDAEGHVLKADCDINSIENIR